MTFGPPNVVPVPGDYDGTVKTDIAVFDPRANTSNIIRSGSTRVHRLLRPAQRPAGPLVGDFDGDGQADIAVFDPVSNTFYVIRSGTNTAYTASFGPPNVVPLGTTTASSTRWPSEIASGWRAWPRLPPSPCRWATAG